MRTRFAGALSRAMSAIAALCLVFLLGAPAEASQGSCIMPTTGTVAGLTLVNDINACNSALLSLNSGASAPLSPTTGMLFYNTATNYIQQYDGANWLNLWYVDATNHLTSMDIGGGVIGQTIASASTTDLGSIPQPFKTITGTTTITSLGSSAKVGSIHVVVFSGALTLTYNATSLIIPGQTNQVTAAGDNMIAVYLGSGNWRVLHYIPITGAAVSSIAGNTGAFTLGNCLANSGNVLQVAVPCNLGQIWGLTLSTAGGSGTFGIALGIAGDPIVGGMMRLASNYTKGTASWVVGSGNGSLDTGSISPNSWYYVFLMERPDTGIVDVCVSAVSVNACSTGGAIPSAYTMFRRIGAMKTDGSSHWVAFTQVGDEFIWAAPVQDVSTSNPTGLNTLSVPPNIIVSAKFLYDFSCTSTGSFVVIQSPLIATQAPNTPAGNIIGSNVVGSSINGYAQILTNTAAQIRLANNGIATITFFIVTSGWIDTRGK
jgi:hypothetical protein